MKKQELKELGKLLVDVHLSDDKIDPIERVYRWCLLKYREQAPKKLSPLDYIYNL